MLCAYYLWQGGQDGHEYLLDSVGRQLRHHHLGRQLGSLSTGGGDRQTDRQTDRSRQAEGKGMGEGEHVLVGGDGMD